MLCRKSELKVIKIGFFSPSIFKVDSKIRPEDPVEREREREREREIREEK